MRNVKAVSFILAAVLLLGGCAKTAPDAVTVDISALEYACVSRDEVCEALSRWQSDNPDTSIVVRENVGPNDLVSLAVMGEDHLPDVFVTDSRTGRLLAEAGLAVDLTGLAPDVDTFTYGGEVYAYPVSVESVSVIVYDPLAWDGSSPVGFDSSDPYTLIDCYVSALIGDDAGQTWLRHMVDGDMEASFTDAYFVDRMNDALNMMNEDIPYSSETELIDAFVSGECPAVLVSGSEARLLLQTVRTDNPGLYERIEFSTLTDGCLPYGYPYGVFIRTGLDDERLVECVQMASELASSVSGGDDDTAVRLDGCIDDSSHTGILSQYFVYDFWYLAYENDYPRLINGEITAEEFAENLQNYYEMYYIY